MVSKQVFSHAWLPVYMIPYLKPEPQQVCVGTSIQFCSLVSSQKSISASCDKRQNDKQREYDDGLAHSIPISLLLVAGGNSLEPTPLSRTPY
eukprot:scaffold23396_cov47-Attheya_sp.AAC.2